MTTEPAVKGRNLWRFKKEREPELVYPSEYVSGTCEVSPRELPPDEDLVGSGAP
jgi:hypothetical protein